MTDEEKMKLAREYAAKTFDARSRKFPNSATMERYHAKVIRQGEGDDYDAVQSALAAINALAPRLEEAEKLLREVCDDLARSTPIQMPDPRISEDVEKLAVASGYGAIMQTASCLWRQYLADKGYPKGGEFIAGPCRTTAEMIIGRITAFLKQGEAS